MLFRIAFFVEGKHLEKVLSAVSGVALNMEAPQPVVNATVQKGRVTQASSAVSMKGRLIEVIKQTGKGKTFTTTQLKEAITGLGGTGTSFNHFAVELIKAKVLKRKGRGEFTIL